MQDESLGQGFHKMFIQVSIRLLQSVKLFETLAKVIRHPQNFPAKQIKISTIVSSASTEMNSNFP